MNKVKLKDITTNITDGTHSTIKDVQGGRCYLLSCKNIKNGKVNIGDSERRIDEETLDKLKKRTHVDKNDVLITWLMLEDPEGFAEYINNKFKQY